MYVAAKRGNDFVNYCYQLVNRSWETLSSFAGLANRISSLCSVDDYLYAVHHSKTPYRYHISTNQWQYVANLRAPSNNMPESSFCNEAALLVYKSRVYVLHGRGVRRCWGSRRNGYYYLWEAQVANVFCFDQKRNMWEQKVSTSTNHFGSSLLVVNN